MVCKSDVFVGVNEQNKQWTNWNGDVQFTAEEYFEPAHSGEEGPQDGLLQLVHTVARATNEQRHLKAIGSLAGQALGIKEVEEGIWLVSFMEYDLGYIDLEEKTLQPLDNHFGPKV